MVSRVAHHDFQAGESWSDSLLQGRHLRPVRSADRGELAAQDVMNVNNTDHADAQSDELMQLSRQRRLDILFTGASTPCLDQHIHRIRLPIPEIQPDATIRRLGDCRGN